MEVLHLLFEGIAAVGVLFGFYTYHKDSLRRKQQDTLNAYLELQHNTFSKLNMWMPSEIKEACENRRSDGYKELSGYLAEIELFCLGINQGIYDFDTFYKMAHGYFDNERGTLRVRLLPLLEVKLVDAKEEYYYNIRDMWGKMQKSERKYKKCKKKLWSKLRKWRMN